jgi:beta-glucosidase
MVNGSEYSFPPGFLWGAASASHQVEGGNRWNDWWEAESRGQLPHRSGDACNHYELYEQDFDLARSLGHNAHRFSIEWSRVEPEPGAFDTDALEHYASVVRALRDRGIEPVVTLHHFTNPVWFSGRGGWLRDDCHEPFARYVEHVARHLPGVKYWVTINEPTVLVKHGYGSGDWPPFIKGAPRRAALAMQGLARAHLAAFRVLHRLQPDCRVSFAHSAPLIVPCDPGRSFDRFSVWVRNWILHRYFFKLIGIDLEKPSSSSPPSSLDWVGLNYYTRSIVRHRWRGRAMLVGEDCLDSHHDDIGARNSLGWEICADGLRAVLERFAQLGLPVMVTENGLPSEHDGLRVAFIRDHLQAVARALRAGVPVLGYLHWTLMDNFEWALGTTAKFGLAAVEDRTQRRIPRPSAEVYAGYCRRNAVDMSANSSR